MYWDAAALLNKFKAVLGMTCRHFQLKMGSESCLYGPTIIKIMIGVWSLWYDSFPILLWTSCGFCWHLSIFPFYPVDYDVVWNKQFCFIWLKGCTLDVQSLSCYVHLKLSHQKTSSFVCVFVLFFYLFSFFFLCNLNFIIFVACYCAYIYLGVIFIISLFWNLAQMKTGCVALVLCLNISVDPPDVIKISPCARMECWIGAFTNC